MDAEKIPLDENFRFRISSVEKKKSPDNGNQSSDEGNISSDERNTSPDGPSESSDEEEDIPPLKWDMENEDLADICYSECFFIGEKTNVFYLELCPKDEDSATMALWQLRGKALKTFYLLFGLDYVDNPKFFLYKKNTLNKNIREHPRKININGLYDIRNVKTNGLKLIGCFVLYAEEFNETGKIYFIFNCVTFCNFILSLEETQADK